MDNLNMVNNNKPIKESQFKTLTVNNQIILKFKHNNFLKDNQCILNQECNNNITLNNNKWCINNHLQ